MSLTIHNTPPAPEPVTRWARRALAVATVGWMVAAGSARAEVPRAAAQARMSDTPRRAELPDDARRVRGSERFARGEGTGKLDKKEDRVAGGTHWRIKTDVGAVHVWVPEGYQRKGAGTVVYVHGYGTDADGAWRDHDLARQFRASKQNALFIVPDAPSSNAEDVKWHALTELRRAIARANIRIPDGPTVVMGHSGAFRTVMKWVDHKVVAQVILLDALYGGEKAFDDFIGSGKRAKQHRLIVIGNDTAEESQTFIRRYPFAVARNSMPASTEGFAKKEKRAKLLYVRSQFEHMAMVTNGKVIPLLLRLTPLASVGAAEKEKEQGGKAVVAPSPAPTMAPFANPLTSAAPPSTPAP
jgi:hypothetical protein